jgi:signal transduction histidine kinase
MSSHDRPIQRSLRARIALGVGLPVLALLASLSLTHYWNERRLLQGQMELTAYQLGEMLAGSLRHMMLTNDRARLDKVLADVGQMQSVDQVQILDLQGEVKADSQAGVAGTVRGLNDRGCVECHSLPPASMPRAIRLASAPEVLRIGTPIVNDAACAGCHPASQAHLGMLLVDVSLADVDAYVLGNLKLDLGLSGLGTVLVTFGMYFLIHFLVVRRVEAFRRPMADFARGDFQARLATPLAPADELDDLARTFNRMADRLESHAREQELVSELRQEAVLEERDRIARELHDGLAQVLGYVNTKAMAVRLMLHRGQVAAAERNLRQLEEAARGLFTDVREAILGLRATAHAGAGLTASLRDFTEQFSRLSSLPVELVAEAQVEALILPADTELQLLRIVQEALANVRKHASARRAAVLLSKEDGVLDLTVCDDGVGFEPQRPRGDGRPHFGLTTMRERAEAIGAAFSVLSQCGEGTIVHVCVRLSEG